MRARRSRFLDELVTAARGAGTDGIAAGNPARREVRRRRDRAAVPADRGDLDRVAGVARQRQGRQPDHRRGDAPAQRQHPKRSVILVSKDINMRIKARALGIAAEDYFNDKVLEDTELLYPGMRELPGDFWDRHGKGMESWQQGGHTYYRVTGPLVPSLLVNEFVYQEKARRSAVLRDGQGHHRARRRCCRRSRTTRTRRTTSGASWRATASRTSRSTC